MELPDALRRMLESACDNDVLKSWSVYQEKEGVYSFKIRFVSSPVRHVEHSSGDNPPAAIKQSGSFKRKNAKQVERDNKRQLEFNSRRVTRSQTCQQSSQPIVTGQDKTTGQELDCNSSTEDFRYDTTVQDSFLNANSPVFTAIALDTTDRELHDIDCESIVSTSDLEIVGSCHPQCCYGSFDIKDADKNDLYRCTGCAKCPSGLTHFCSNCLDQGVHMNDRKFLVLVEKVT